MWVGLVICRFYLTQDAKGEIRRFIEWFCTLGWVEWQVKRFLFLFLPTRMRQNDFYPSVRTRYNDRRFVTSSPHGVHHTSSRCEYQNEKTPRGKGKTTRIESKEGRPKIFKQPRLSKSSSLQPVCPFERNEPSR